MKLNIVKYKIQKIEDTQYQIDIPEEPEYHFETGVRRSIAIIPEWTEWQVENDGKPEEIWRLHFVCVHGSFENKIEKTTININELKNFTGNDRSPVYFFLNYRDKYSLRTKEQFEADYQVVLENINIILREQK